MTETEWIVRQYLYQSNNSEMDLNLEDAKNFVFIWSLFESQSHEILNVKKFEEWAKNLKIRNRDFKTEIVNNRLNNTIYGELVESVDKSFNHFYQKYKNDPENFINYLYNQDIKNVNMEKSEFIRFTTDMDDKNKTHKIIFLFFISKRIRNKFFHGVKCIADVSREHKEFELINKFLISISSLLENK